LTASSIRKVLQKLQLPNPETLIEKPPSKLNWKTNVRKAINYYWQKQWNETNYLRAHSSILPYKKMLLITSQYLELSWTSST
jgi:hypothetical protein